MSNLRKFWQTLQMVHTVVYFSPEARTAYKEIGLRGYWSGYFASRSAPLGEPSAELVTAIFYGFSPAKVAKAIPEAWSLADRDDILSTRLDIATRALQTVLGTDEDTKQRMSSAADQLLEVTESLSYAGRPLAAAHYALPTPSDPVGRLWHAASILREYRGDVHLAALVIAGLRPVDSEIIQVAQGKALDGQQAGRGWTDEEWAEGILRLQQSGWIDENHALTDVGAQERERIEQSTDAACDDAVAHLADTTVADDLLAWARIIARSDLAPPRSAKPQTESKPSGSE